MLRFEKIGTYFEAKNEDGKLVAQFWEDGHVSFVGSTTAAELRQIADKLDELNGRDGG